jgi:hypothetical protein
MPFVIEYLLGRGGRPDEPLRKEESKAGAVAAGYMDLLAGLGASLYS